MLQFSKETLADMYSAYIDNFLNAKDAVRIAKEAKPAFHKFLEVSHGDEGMGAVSGPADFSFLILKTE